MTTERELLELAAQAIDHRVEYFSKHGGDKQAARMWATLRAAAELGRRKG